MITSLVVAVLLAGQTTPAEHADLMSAREAVWRAWFANDTTQLRELLPEDLVAINADEDHWHDLPSTLEGAAAFRADGGRLIALEFPRTKVQRYGDVAILYSLYRLEMEVKGAKQVTTGRATEVFIKRNGRWMNPGWHMDSGK